MKLSEDRTILNKVQHSDIQSDGSFDIPKGVVSIADFAFNDCSVLRTLVIPKEVISIGRYAFFGCNGLIAVTIHAQITSIGDCTFSGCDSLQFLEIPSGVVSIGSLAFDGCCSLQTLAIPSGIHFMGSRVFDACSSLHSIVIATEDASEIARLTALLPVEFQNKVTTQALAHEALVFMKEQLIKVAKTLQINGLYPFLNLNSRFKPQVEVKDVYGKSTTVPCSKLPDDVFQHMNDFLIPSNPYYQKAEKQMRAVPLPKNQAEMETYQRQVEAIANTVIQRAKSFQSFFLEPQFKQNFFETPTNTNSNGFCFIL